MKKISHYFVFSLTFIFIYSCSPNIFGYFRMVTYDEIREEGGFNSTSMLDVSRIIPSGSPLSEDEIRELIESKTLTNLHTLDLSNQKNVTDVHIKRLSENPAFKRIINLDLSGTRVTSSSIMDLLGSNMGTIRDLPQLSARFGLPSSTIYLTALDTQIENNFERNVFPSGGKCFTIFSQGVHLDYLNPVTGQKTSLPVDGAMKMIEVTM